VSGDLVPFCLRTGSEIRDLASNIAIALTCSSPNQILRSFPPLQAAKVIQVATSFAAKIPADIYEQIINHAK
jgi:hypothetical protein